MEKLSISTQKKGYLHGDRVFWTIDLTGQAIPTFIESHMRLTRFGVHGQAIDRTRVDADAAAADALVRIHHDGHVEAALRLRGRHLPRLCSLDAFSIIE